MELKDINDAMKSMLAGIKHMIQAELKKVNFDQTYIGVIREKTGDTYSVVIQGREYTNTPSLNKTDTINVGETVYILFPKGDANNRVILK